MTLAYDAMVFARKAHMGQSRKYTNEPYWTHLAEVAGIVSTVAVQHGDWHMAEQMAAVAWLHDTVEDTDVTLEEIERRFGSMVAVGVSGLTDNETGNRAERKAKSRDRLSRCARWIQTIKCADLISNTSSIVEHDPKFAAVYLEETRLLLDVLTYADPRMIDIARSQCR